MLLLLLLQTLLLLLLSLGLLAGPAAAADEPLRVGSKRFTES